MGRHEPADDEGTTAATSSPEYPATPSDVARPAIVIVHRNEDALSDIVRDITAHYGDYRTVSTTSAAHAEEVCRQLREEEVPVALVLAADEVDGTRGTTLLAALRAIHPDASRGLITTHDDVEEAIRAVNEIGIHGYVLHPWDARHERLYPTVDGLLADWRIRASVPYLVVGSIMDRDEAVARIADDASLRDAAHAVAATGVGDLMVVDERGGFVGVLSEGDILRNALPDFDEIVQAGGSPRDAYQLFVRNAQELSTRPILPLVIRDPIVMRPSDHAAEATTILVERQIRRLPVVEDGRLVGTVSRTNICRVIVGDGPEGAG